MSLLKTWLEERVPQLVNNIKTSALDKNRPTVVGIQDTASVLDFLVDFLARNSNKKEENAKKVMKRYLVGITPDEPIEHLALKFNRTGLLNQAIRNITDKEMPELIYLNLNGFRHRMNLKPSYNVSKEDIKKWRNSGELKKNYLDKLNDSELLQLFNDIAQSDTKINYLELFA